MATDRHDYTAGVDTVTITTIARNRSAAPCMPYFGCNPRVTVDDEAGTQVWSSGGPDEVYGHWFDNVKRSEQAAGLTLG